MPVPARIYRSPDRMLSRVTMPSIVIAHSDVHLRASLCSLLESRPGWTVLAQTATGSEAIRCAQRCKPDVVLIGSDTPDGGEISSRALRLQPGILVVLLAKADAEDIALSIPWEPDPGKRLLQTIETALAPQTAA